MRSAETARALSAAPPPAGSAPRPVLLAVSGGPDSLALLLLAAENRDHLSAAGYSLVVATVDHGLRAGSGDEAAFVGRVSRDLALPHRTLRWEGPKPGGNIAGEARAARYRLLAEHAGAIGAVAVLTAHHQDDQIETHHLAALRRAGDRGLAGMRASRMLAPGIRLVRPFLRVPGAALKASVAARGIAAVDDPTNRDPRFERARLRAALHPDPESRRQTLARIAGHAARRDAEDAALGGAFAILRRDGALAVDDCATVRIGRDAFRDLSPDLGDVLLSRVLRAVGGAEYAPSRMAVSSLGERLRADAFAGATLGGARVKAGGVLVFLREYGRSGIASRPFSEAGTTSFDRRMTIRFLHAEEDRSLLSLVAFGETGRGNAIEKTLPVVMGGGGRVLAAHPRLLPKLPETVRPLDVSEDVSFRIFADLNGSGAT